MVHHFSSVLSCFIFIILMSHSFSLNIFLWEFQISVDKFLQEGLMFAFLSCLRFGPALGGCGGCGDWGTLEAGSQTCLGVSLAFPGRHWFRFNTGLMSLITTGSMNLYQYSMYMGCQV